MPLHKRQPFMREEFEPRRCKLRCDILPRVRKNSSHTSVWCRWTVNEYAARLAPQNYRRLVEAPIELKPEAKARTSSAARTIRSLWGDYGGQPQEPDQHQPSCSLDSVPEEDPACPEFEDIELTESPMNTEDLTTNELEQLLRPWLLEKRRLNVGSSAVPPQRDRVKCTECVLTRIGGGFIRVG